MQKNGECCARGQIKMFLLPYCQLLIKTVRQDSPPFKNANVPLSKLLLEKRLSLRLSQEQMARRIGISYCTYKNWELGHKQPAKRLWACVRTLTAVH